MNHFSITSPQQLNNLPRPRPAQLDYMKPSPPSDCVFRCAFHYIFISYLFIVAFATTEAPDKPPSFPSLPCPRPASSHLLPLWPYILNVDLKCVLMQFLTQILLLHIWLMSGLRTNFARRLASPSCHAPCFRLTPLGVAASQSRLDQCPLP